MRQNSPGLVSELLGQGAAPAVPTVHGDTACHLAVSCGAAECLALLLRHAKPEDVNIFNDSGEEETVHSCKAVAGLLGLTEIIIAPLLFRRDLPAPGRHRRPAGLGQDAAGGRGQP